MIIVGHRGARNEAPENTLEGFIHAHNSGTRHVELDLRISKDQEIICLHDRSLQRTTGQQGFIDELDSSVLSQLNASADFSGWSGPATIPTLRRLFNECPRFDSYQLEVKTDNYSNLKKLTDTLISLITELKVEDRVIITSIDFRVPYLIRKKAGHLRRGHVVEKKAGVRLAKFLHQDWLCVHWPICNPELVSWCKKNKRHLSVWTVNDIEDAESLFDMGVYSLITDVPNKMLKHFS